MIGKKSKKPELEEKLLDVDASIQGNVVFNDPVNLRINGRFEGTLTTKGNLTIGESARISADIIGDNIVVAGEILGDVIAEKSLKLVSPARLIGNIRTPSLTINDGAVLHGECQMVFDEAELSKLQAEVKRNSVSLEEAARYLEVEPSLIMDWANSGKLSGRHENGAWRFERSVLDEWVRSGKIK